MCQIFSPYGVAGFATWVGFSMAMGQQDMWSQSQNDLDGQPLTNQKSYATVKNWAYNML